MNPQNRSYGQLPIPTIPGERQIPARLVSVSVEGQEEGPNYRFGGMLTYEKPIKEWFGDIVLPAGQTTILRAGVELPNNCVQVRFINVAGTPAVNFGQGNRQIFNFDGYNNTEIGTMAVTLGAADACTVQAAGTGD